MTVHKKFRQRGFSMVELMIVVAIILIVSAMVVPNAVNAMRTLRLRGSCTDFASLLQQARVRAALDNAYHPVRFQAASGTTPEIAYVDLDNSSTYKSGDPMIMIASDVSTVAKGSAPKTSSLESAFTASSGTTYYDGTSTPPAFSPRGIPCLLTSGICNTTGGVANAFETYFQSQTNTCAWEAVTVTPAGRVATWYFLPSGSGCTNGTWNKL